MLNNFAYVLIQSCAKSLADEFEASKLIGVIQWYSLVVHLLVDSFGARCRANVFFGIVFKGLNTWYFEKYPCTTA